MSFSLNHTKGAPVCKLLGYRAASHQSLNLVGSYTVNTYVVNLKVVGSQVVCLTVGQAFRLLVVSPLVVCPVVHNTPWALPSPSGSLKKPSNHSYAGSSSGQLEVILFKAISLNEISPQVYVTSS